MAIAVAAAALIVSLLGSEASTDLVDEDGVDQLRVQVQALAPGAVSSLAWRAIRALHMVASADRSELAQLLDDEPEWAETWHRHLQSLIEGLDALRGHLPPA